MNGQGTLTVPNVFEYAGDFIDDKMNGKGTITFPNGEKYVGELKDATLKGGTLTHPNGEYVGEFKHYLPDGRGTLTHPNGQKYAGEFENGKKNGHATYYAADGSVTLRGIWEDDYFIKRDFGIDGE